MPGDRAREAEQNEEGLKPKNKDRDREKQQDREPKKMVRERHYPKTTRSHIWSYYPKGRREERRHRTRRSPPPQETLNGWKF